MTPVIPTSGALNVQTPLLGPSYDYLDTPSNIKVMDSTGRILSLPTDHWVCVHT